MGDFSEDKDLELMITQVTDKELLDNAICDLDDEISLAKLLDMLDMNTKTIGELVEIAATHDKSKQHAQVGSGTCGHSDPLREKLDEESSFIKLLDEM